MALPIDAVGPGVAVAALLSVSSFFAHTACQTAATTFTFPCHLQVQSKRNYLHCWCLLHVLNATSFCAVYSFLHLLRSLHLRKTDLKGDSGVHLAAQDALHMI